MMSTKSWIRIMLAILALGSFLMTACGREKSQEQMVENTIKKTTGKDVDVKMQKGKIEFEEKGSKTVIEETTTWPPDMFKDVPPFTLGKIERVVKSREEAGMQKFNIYFVDLERDAIDKYADVLKKNGWQTDLMQMGDKGGYLNAQKGNMGMNFGFSLERKDGMLAVFNTP